MDTLIARRELRIRSRGVVKLLPELLPPTEATIWDVSPGGLALRTEAAMPINCRVEIDAGTHTATGTIRHCTPEEQGYRIGIELIDE